jgi:hypothetical protein
MSGDLPTTTEGTHADPVSPHSLTGNLWWLLPPAADRVAWAVSALGAAFALTITVAQLRVQGAS